MTGPFKFKFGDYLRSSTGDEGMVTAHAEYLFSPGCRYYQLTSAVREAPGVGTHRWCEERTLSPVGEAPPAAVLTVTRVNEHLSRLDLGPGDGDAAA